MKKLSLNVVSDTHYYSKKNWVDGNPYDYPPKPGQLFIRGSEEIVKQAFKEIKDDKDSDIVLVSGDITNNGEITSHEEIVELLRDLQKSGKRVFAITATHDYCVDHPYGFDKNNNEVEVPVAKREELFSYYHEFGPDQASAYHEESMSYTVELDDEYMLLAMNDDIGYKQCGYKDECFDWALKQIERAHENGKFVIYMTHHPVLSPSPFYNIIGADNLLENHLQRSREIANHGVPCAITGHTHMHNISHMNFDGNDFYDVTTGSLTGYPVVYRQITFDPDNREIDVKSKFIKKAEGLDVGDVSLEEFTHDLLFKTVLDAIDQAAFGDYEKFVEFGISMSLQREISEKLKPIIVNVAKMLSRVNFGHAWKLTCLTNGVSKKEIACVDYKLILPFLVEAGASLYRGNAHVDANSPEYRISKAFLGYIDKILVKENKKISEKISEFTSFSDAILPLIHNDGIDDYNAVLKY